MKHKKPLALILSLITALTLSIPVIAQEGNIPDKIIILHTNDVHCGIDDNIGYAGLVSCKAQMEQVYGRENVTLVDAGDAIQGGAIGTLSDGAFPVDIMNQAGPLGKRHVHSELRRHDSRKTGNFNRMDQHALSVACSVF